MDTRRRSLLLGTAALGVSALAGCGLSERPYVERRDWPLTVTRPAPLPPRAGGRVLLVRTVEPGPGMQARGIQTLLPDGSVDVAFYEQWAAPPAEAVDADLRNWLAQSGLFAAVISPGSQASPDVVLEARLTALIADPRAHEARATMSVLLLSEQGLTTQVLMQAMLTGRAPLVEGADAPAKVDALKAAVADLLGKAEQAIRPFAGPPPRASGGHPQR
ncbi:MAG TPA: ABC-type transport auxiliary lipoprotein family protein [Acidisphaera sp.]|nr:ABC-type transport auxiliary lipoprotein family protein [Acidisphaera sp.]